MIAPFMAVLTAGVPGTYRVDVRKLASTSERYVIETISREIVVR